MRSTEEIARGIAGIGWGRIPRDSVPLIEEAITAALDAERREGDRLRGLLWACERYALRVVHDAGHPLDAANAKAIIEVARKREDSDHG